MSCIIIAGAVILIGCGQQPSSSGSFTTRTGSAAVATPESVIDEQTIENIELASQASPLYILEDLNSKQETITLYEVDSGRQLRYKYNMTTRFLNKYGDYTSSTNFVVGSVVELGELLPSSGALSMIQMSDDVWVYKELKSYDIDEDRGVFGITGQDNYRITDRSRAYSDTSRILFSDIGKEDVLTVIGQDKNIISVAVTTGHGYIQLSNTDLFANSLIFIGDKIVTMIYSDTTIEVPEGTYSITVANNGWGGTGEYTVNRNDITEVNLDDLKGEGPSYCEMSFVVTVPNTIVYIDGKQVDPGEPLWIQYGSHKLMVAAEGYNSWNKTLVVNSASAVLSLELDATEKNTPVPTAVPNTDTNVQTTPSVTAVPNVTTDTNTVGTEYNRELDYLSTLSDLIGNLLE